MINLASNIELLYLFKLEQGHLLEYKVKDLPKDADPSLVYHWYFAEPLKCRITKLHFKSMSSSTKFEFREFEEGSLKFNKEMVEFSKN